jgi:cyclic dehypoxanthinyl futalosine synthase
VAGTGTGHRGQPEVLAISRLYLSNFLRSVELGDPGIESLPDGTALWGNDVGSVMLEENVVRAAGVTNCTTEEELRRIIHDAEPAQRDIRTYFLN